MEGAAVVVEFVAQRLIFDGHAHKTLDMRARVALRRATSLFLEIRYVPQHVRSKIRL